MVGDGDQLCCWNISLRLFHQLPTKWDQRHAIPQNSVSIAQLSSGPLTFLTQPRILVTAPMLRRGSWVEHLPSRFPSKFPTLCVVVYQFFPIPSPILCSPKFTFSLCCFDPKVLLPPSIFYSHLHRNVLLYYWKRSIFIQNNNKFIPSRNSGFCNFDFIAWLSGGY